MNVKIDIHNRNLETRIKALKSWDIPEVEIKKILDFLTDLELGKVNKGRKISQRRQLKYLDILKIPLLYFNKNMPSLTLKDIERFEKDLTSDKILSHKKTPFAHSTKADIKKTFKIYLKWRIGIEKTEKLTGWLDTRVKKKTPDYLKENEILKLYKACKNNGERFLIAVLFDSGARIEEFLNIRYEDIQLPNKNENFVKLTLKEEYSKTKGRVISLYWSKSLEAITDFLKEREQEGIKSNEPLYTKTYDAVRVWLVRLGKKVLKKDIYAHLFRHSSATFYASQLNRQELCYRYGWAFSSNMPDVYISRAGMNNKELDNKFENTELGELKTKLSKEEFERKKLQEDFGKREKDYVKMFENLKDKIEELESNKTKIIKVVS